MATEHEHTFNDKVALIAGGTGALGRDRSRISERAAHSSRSPTAAGKNSTPCWPPPRLTTPRD